MKLTRQTINAVGMIFGIALLILVGLTFYNYYLSGKFNFSPLVTAGLIALVFILARKSVKEEN